MIKTETDIIILGGGWSGLIAADILSRKGKRIVLLEKEPELGGLARTLDYKGFKFDIGGHGLFFRNPISISYLKDNFGDVELLQLRKKAKILFNDRYINYPAGLSSIFFLGKKYVMKIILDLISLKRPSYCDNFEKWVLHNYGRCLYEIYFKEYTEKVWGLSCDKLSAFWADERIGKNNPVKSIAKILSYYSDEKDTLPFFYYPRQGIGTLINSLEEKLRNTCVIYKGVNALRVRIGRVGFDSVSFVCGNNEFQISFKELVSSIPIAELVPTLTDIPVGVSNKTAEKIKYRSLILVNLLCSSDMVSKWHWCYFSSKDIFFSRIHEPKFWSKDMAKEGATLLCSEVFCDYGDKYWNMEDGELIKRVKDSLRYKGAPAIDTINDGCVKRIKYAYPFYYKGFETWLNEIKDFLRSFRNMHLIGRNGTHSYFNMEECLQDVIHKTDQLK